MPESKVTNVISPGRPAGLRLLLVTQYYAPEVGAPQTRLRETVAGLTRRGMRVTVVAPPPSYPLGVVPEGFRWWRPGREWVDGAEVIRLPALIIPGTAMSRRIAGHLTFAFTAISVTAIARRFDVALVESPPLFLALVARALRLAGVPYVLHVADPWPDFPIAMGYLRRPIERRLAFALENLAYRGASAITTVSPGLVDLLGSKASATGRVTLLSNAVDLHGFDPERDPETARRQLGWDDAFTIVYLGTVGLAQGVGTLLDAAACLAPDVSIRIIGEGAEKTALVARARDLGLSNVTFHRSVARAQVPHILAAADAALVMLRRGPLFDNSLPTKLLEAMAAGRPVVVSADGLASRIVRAAGAGHVARAEDAHDLATAIDACHRDQSRLSQGRAGRAYVADHFEREAILDTLGDIIERVARPASPASQPR
jgi:glycosyltransferase involved in cell wall biosynthesis